LIQVLAFQRLLIHPLKVEEMHAFATNGLTNK